MEGHRVREKRGERERERERERDNEYMYKPIYTIVVTSTE